MYGQREYRFEKLSRFALSPILLCISGFFGRCRFDLCNQHNIAFVHLDRYLALPHRQAALDL